MARGWLGVGLDNLSAEQMKELDIEQTGGILVKRVSCLTRPPRWAACASATSFCSGTANRHGRHGDLTLDIARRKAGDKVEMFVLRGAVRKKLTITIGQRPDDVNVRK